LEFGCVVDALKCVANALPRLGLFAGLACVLHCYFQRDRLQRIAARHHRASDPNAPTLGELGSVSKQVNHNL
jgi:hypothetical protein